EARADELPQRMLVALLGQWPEGWPVELLEQLAAAGAVVTHAPPVEIHQQLADALVERVQREERLVTQPCEDPALGDLHADLDLGLVTWRARARGQDHR